MPEKKAERPEGQMRRSPRRITGNCAKHQRALTVAVKRARHISLMPYSVD